LDTVGAVIGPLLAVALMASLAHDMRRVFWAATLPAALSVLLLVVAVREPEGPQRVVARLPIAPSALWRLPARYWFVVLLGSVLTLARFSEASLVLRAGSIGLGLTWVPLVLVIMNVVYAVSAYPAGVAADRRNRRILLALGLAALIVADLVLAAARTAFVVFIGVGLWGLHMGLTQGLLATLVAASAPADLRGTAFGVFHLTTGLVLLLASVVAGMLWSHFGPSATFLAGATFTAIALAGLVLVDPERQPIPPRCDMLTTTGDGNCQAPSPT
jgi:MFS family permease